MRKSYPTSNDNPSDNRDKASVSSPSLLFPGHQISKQRSEKWRGGPHSLIEGDGQILQGNIPTHHRAAEDNAEGGNSQELGPGFDPLRRHHFEEHDGDVAEDGTGRHVAHCEEDGEGESIVGEEEFVEEEDPDVGRVPEDYEEKYEECVLSRCGRRRRRGRHCFGICGIVGFGFVDVVGRAIFISLVID